MSKFDKSIDEIFNIDSFSDPMNDERTNIKTVLPVIQPTTTESSDLDGDLKSAYDQTKDNLQDLISQGMEAMDDMLQIAKEGQHPRAFEVAATMIKNVAEVNEKLINLQKQMKDITGTKNQGQLNVGKAAIFVGSTAELSKMIKNEIKTINE